MSGPKVVRVVTREELVARGEGSLAQLDAAIAEWRRVGERNGVVDEADIASVEKRRVALRKLLNDDKFDELESQALKEVSFLQHDAQARLKAASAREVEKRNSANRIAQSASSLLAALTVKGVDLPGDLKGRLSSTRDIEALKDAIKDGLELLSSNPPRPVDEKGQDTLAYELGRGEKRMTLAEWEAAQPPLPEDGIIQEIEEALADIALSFGEEVAQPFRERADKIVVMSDSGRRAMLADSLLADLTAESRKQRARAVARLSLEGLERDLRRFDNEEAHSLVQQIRKALEHKRYDLFEALTLNASSVIEANVERHAAHARRTAILSGLASLGYEVAEGMETVWVRDGRLVVRCAVRPEYGVEVGGGSGAARLQLRAVAFSSSPSQRDATRDKDMEAAWCDEFAQMRELAQSNGVAIDIEKSFPVGTGALKVVDAPNQVIEAETAADIPSIRQQQRE